VFGNGTAIMAVDGSIDDVNDAMVNMQYTLTNGAPWGTLPIWSLSVAHFLVDDYGKYGFCDCLDQPGMVKAPEASCNKYVYGNQSWLVLDCQGDEVVQVIPTVFNLWWYGEVPVQLRFNDLNKDGKGDRDFNLRPIVNFATPESDDRKDWSIFDPEWSVGVGPFGRANDSSKCPMLGSAFINTDVTNAGLSRQMLLRSYFALPIGVVAVRVRVVSDRDAFLYINGDLVYHHKVPKDSDGCPVSSLFELSHWYSPDYAAKYNEDGTTSIVNEISLLGHNNTAFLHATILATRCTGNKQPQCGQPCTRTADCFDPKAPMDSRGCMCSTEMGHVTAVYNFAASSVAVGKCIPRTCGNGVVDSEFEECDDGNTDPNDTCDNQCRRVVTNGRCVIKQYTQDSIRELIQEAMEAKNDTRVAELQGILEMLNCAATGNTACLPTSPEAGYDVFFRYCDGSCGGSTRDNSRPCRATWRQRQDRFFIASCDCDQGGNEGCSMRLAAPAASMAGTTESRETGTDVYGR
jgi:cysteine-rich repeat protein